MLVLCMELSSAEPPLVQWEQAPHPCGNALREPVCARILMVISVEHAISRQLPPREAFAQLLGHAGAGQPGP